MTIPWFLLGVGLDKKMWNQVVIVYIVDTYLSFHNYDQEKPRADQGVEYSATRLPGSVISYKIFAELLRSMSCKLLEAIPFLLEESILQCHALSDDTALWPCIWYSILAKRKENV